MLDKFVTYSPLQYLLYLMLACFYLEVDYDKQNWLHWLEQMNEKLDQVSICHWSAWSILEHQIPLYFESIEYWISPEM